jgi:uncharacterized damage-inducible protein DinB
MDNTSATAERLVRIHEGDPWHGSSTLVLLAGVSATDAATRPVAGAHTIWEVVLHMTTWTREVHARLRGEPPGEPRDGDWPPMGEPTAARWEAAVRALTEANAALAAAVREMSDADARREPTVDRDRGLGTGFSILETVEGLVAHHAYHAGQIALLRRAVAAV